MTNPRDTFLEHLPLIEQIIRSVGRGRRMNLSEIEDFESYAKLRLIENDYTIIAKFKGRSAFGTYLTTVISRFLNDYRDHEWGKWRNSAEAKRLGPLALELERLLARDQRSLEECFIELAPRYPEATRSSLEKLAARFPVRHRRRMVRLEDAEEPKVEGDEAAIENRQFGALVSSIVSGFISRLPKDDQYIFQLRLENDMPILQIAKAIHEDGQSLYRRLQKHFADLRVELEKAGISAADLAALNDPDGSLLDFRPKTEAPCPSNNEKDPEGAPEENA
jgi:RNA polymerase sigma factor (sigma-70 family)